MLDQAELIGEIRQLRIEIDGLRAKPERKFACQRLIKSAVVMDFFGFSNRSSFWQFVKDKEVPHVRVTSRRIMFDGLALNHWIAQRDTSGSPRQFAFGEANSDLPASEKHVT